MKINWQSWIMPHSGIALLWRTPHTYPNKISTQQEHADENVAAAMRKSEFHHGWCGWCCADDREAARATILFLSEYFISGEQHTRPRTILAVCAAVKTKSAWETNKNFGLTQYDKKWAVQGNSWVGQGVVDEALRKNKEKEYRSNANDVCRENILMPWSV